MTRLLFSLSLMVALIGSLAIATSAQVPLKANGTLIELNKPGTIEVVISLGDDDGIRVGTKLVVLNEGKVIGTVQVTKAKHDRSYAKIIDLADGKAISLQSQVEFR